MRESTIQTQSIYILRVLQRQGRLLYRRIHTTGVPRKIQGRIVLTKNKEMEGMTDTLVFLPGKRVIHPEFKRPSGGRLSAAQIEWRDSLERLGHVHVVVKNVNDLLVALQKEGVDVSDWMPKHFRKQLVTASESK